MECIGALAGLEGGEILVRGLFERFIACRLSGFCCLQFLHRVVDNLCGRPQDFFAQYAAATKIIDLVDLYTVLLQKAVGQKYPPQQVASELAARGVSEGSQAAVLKVAPARLWPISH